MPTTPEGDPRALQARLDELKWYHSIDVAPGVATKGWWDLRHALPLIPFPDVRGKRVLDIGTWDGFYAYELERRGAAEVVAVDVPDLAGLDYPPEARADPTFDPSHTDEQPRNAGFELLHELFDSKVRMHWSNIYDLDPDEIGTFDLVIVGSLLIHLRDPVRALDAVRRVTGGQLLSIDYVNPTLSMVARRRPVFQLVGVGTDFQWWLASASGLRHLLHVGGFEIEAESEPFLLEPGPAAAPPKGNAVEKRRKVLNRLYAKRASIGHPHLALRAHPRF